MTDLNDLTRRLSEMPADGTITISPLVAALVTKNVDDLARTTNLLLDNLRSQLADRNAELAAIRHRMNELLNGPYAPSENALVQAVFFPSKELMARMREDREDREEES